MLSVLIDFVRVVHSAVTLTDLELVRPYIPAAVLPFVNLQSKLNSGELRQVSVVFANLGIPTRNLNDVRLCCECDVSFV